MAHDVCEEALRALDSAYHNWRARRGERRVMEDLVRVGAVLPETVEAARAEERKARRRWLEEVEKWYHSRKEKDDGGE